MLNSEKFGGFTGMKVIRLLWIGSSILLFFTILVIPLIIENDQDTAMLIALLIISSIPLVLFNFRSPLLRVLIEKQKIQSDEKMDQYLQLVHETYPSKTLLVFNDLFYYWFKLGTCIPLIHMLTNFSLLVLPICILAWLTGYWLLRPTSFAMKYLRERFA